MARGRRPNEQAIIPMREDGDAGHNLEARAIARAAELRPEGISSEVRWIYDRLAPPLCHPTRNRLDEVNVFAFELLCETIARYRRLKLVLDEDGESYSTKGGRNGTQLRSRPEAAQVNVVWGQIRGMLNDFGMTPAGARALGAQAQLGFNFGDEDDDFT